MNKIPKIPGGKKKKNLFRQYNVHVRYTKEEKEVLDTRVEKAGVGLAHFIRQLSLTGKIKACLTEEEKPIFKGLVAMANDLNRLSEIAGKEGNLLAMLHFKEYRNKINELINKMEHA